MSKKVSLKYPIILFSFIISTLLIQSLSFQNSSLANVTFFLIIGVLVYLGFRMKLHLKEIKVTVLTAIFLLFLVADYLIYAI